MNALNAPTTPLTRALATAGLLCALMAFGQVHAEGSKQPSTTSVPNGAITLSDVLQKLNELAAENKTLRDKVDKLEAAQTQQATQVQQQGAQTQQQAQVIEKGVMSVDVHGLGLRI